jgi:DNA-binding transcriptional LysR family regulator
MTPMQARTAGDVRACVDRAVCRAGLAPILADYLRRYPQECYNLAIFVHEDSGLRTVPQDAEQTDAVDSSG